MTGTTSLQLWTVAMPKQLLHLPHDVLDQFWGHLLPPMGPNNAPISLDDLMQIPDPFDLYNVMLTCKVLYGMAYPWVWRRVEVIDAHRGSRWRYLVDHPAAAVHVRLFMVRMIARPKSEAFMFGLLLKAMKLMHNIRVLIHCHSISYFSSEILEELMSKPHLHTLLTCDRSTVHVSAPRNLRHLICISELRTGWTLDSIPNLGSLAFAGREDFSGTSYIPWASLRDIEVSGTENLTAVLDSFTAWKRTHPNTRSPLQEVTFHDSITEHAMCRTLDTFGNQNLTSLCFDCIPFLDASLIRRLAEEFPHVRRLGLTTGYIFSDWHLEPIVIAKTLGRLRMLAWLQWTYSAAPYDFDHRSFDAQSPDVLSALEDHCAASLQRVDLRDADYTYSYERNEGGNFQQEAGCSSRYVTLFNEGWRCGIYDGI